MRGARLLVAMASLFLMVAGASAAEMEFHFGARMEFGLPLDTDAYGDWVPAVKLKPSNAELLLIPGLQQGLRFGSFSVNLEERLISLSSDNAGWEYDLMVIPVTVTGQYHMFSGWGRPVNPYFGLGVGGYFYDNEVDGMSEDGMEPGFQALAGLVFDFESRFLLDAQVRYEMYSFDAPYETRTWDPEDEVWVREFSVREVDGDLIGISLGIRF